MSSNKILILRNQEDTRSLSSFEIQDSNHTNLYVHRHQGFVTTRLPCVGHFKSRQEQFFSISFLYFLFHDSKSTSIYFDLFVGSYSYTGRISKTSFYKGKHSVFTIIHHSWKINRIMFQHRETVGKCKTTHITNFDVTRHFRVWVHLFWFFTVPTFPRILNQVFLEVRVSSVHSTDSSVSFRLRLVPIFGYLLPVLVTKTQ